MKLPHWTQLRYFLLSDPAQARPGIIISSFVIIHCAIKEFSSDNKQINQCGRTRQQSAVSSVLGLPPGWRTKEGDRDIVGSYLGRKRNIRRTGCWCEWGHCYCFYYWCYYCCCYHTAAAAAADTAFASPTDATPAAATVLLLLLLLLILLLMLLLLLLTYCCYWYTAATSTAIAASVLLLYSYCCWLYHSVDERL